ncbi:hypothetical protein Hanom_Chr03g00238731 [Helianthus anomalus]
MMLTVGGRRSSGPADGAVIRACGSSFVRVRDTVQHGSNGPGFWFEATRLNRVNSARARVK